MLEQGHAATSQAAETAQKGFNAGEVIIGHVSNATDHPLIHLPKVFGIDMSVTKHVFMIWLVSVTLFVVSRSSSASCAKAWLGPASATSGSTLGRRCS